MVKWIFSKKIKKVVKWIVSKKIKKVVKWIFFKKIRKVVKWIFKKNKKVVKWNVSKRALTNKQQQLLRFPTFQERKKNKKNIINKMGIG